MLCIKQLLTITLTAAFFLISGMTTPCHATLTETDFIIIDPSIIPECDDVTVPEIVPLKDSGGLWNLALLKTAKPNASSLISCCPLRHSIERLTDGYYNNCRSWIPEQMPAWAETDLGNEYFIQKVVFGSEHTSYHNDRAATKFSILVATTYNSDSSATTWKEVFKYEGEPIRTTTSFNFESVKARFVRVVIAESIDGGEVRIDELEIYGTNALSPNLTLSVSPASSSVSSSAGTTSFAVSNTGSGTMNWTAEVTSGTWLKITSGASGSNSGTIKCSFDANTTTSARTGTIRVTATGATGSPKDITVTQAAGDSPVKPSLTLSSASGSPSGTVTVNLSITNVTGVSVAAISTDIDFDSSIFEAYPSDATNTKNPVAVIGAAGTAAGKRVISNLVDSNTLRVGIYSENTTAIANGVVASITFYIKSTAINGLTTDLTQIPSGSDSNSNDVTITGTKGTVTINSCKLGDCDCNGTVSIAEVQSAVNMYLGKKTVASCCDRDGNGTVSISEVQAIVNNYLGIVPKSKHATRDKKQPAQVNIERAHDGYSLSLIPNKNSISAMSIDVAYPVGLAGKISFTLGASAELAGKELVQNQIQPGITRIGLIDAFDNQSIDDGEILFVHVDGDVNFKITASDEAGKDIEIK